MKKRLFAIVGLLLSLALFLVSCGDTISVIGVNLNEAGEIIVTMSDGTTQNLGKIAAGTSPNNTNDENPQGLSFFPLPDGTYAVSLGTAVYLEKVSIPESYNGKAVTKLVAAVEGMIGDCPLNEISIPHTVTEIGPFAFAEYYRNLETVTFADNSQLKRIGEDAFANCKNLKNICIPHTVIKIGNDAFGGCDSLQCNEYDNAYYLGNDKNPYVVLLKAKNPEISSCIIHPHTIAINGSAFKNCVNLSSIEIPSAVCSIGDQAFCSNLINLTFAEDSQLVELGSIFSYNTAIDQLTLPSGVLRIHLLNLLNAVNCLILPDSITDITGGSWQSPPPDCTIFYVGTATQWQQLNFANIIRPEDLQSITYFYSETIPSSPGNYWHYINNVPTIWE